MRSALLLAAAVALLAAPSASAYEEHDGEVFARISPTEIVLGNVSVERRWDAIAFKTVEIVDKRKSRKVWTRASRDFALGIGATTVGSDAFRVTRTDVDHLPRGGLRLTMHLGGLPGVAVRRIAEAYPGIAGLRTQTILQPTAGIALRDVVLDELRNAQATPVLHAFRAGADWRDPEWTGPEFSLGDPHGGTWRSTLRGSTVDGPGQWLSLWETQGPRHVSMIAEGTDFPSSRGSYDGTAGQLRAQYGQDVVILGPLEESGHIENPSAAPGRQRVAQPGQELALEPVFMAFGIHDGDAQWQFAKYIHEQRLLSEPGRVVFNSDRLDDDRSGAKDDATYAMVKSVADKARRLGIDTFVLDDGWQARSGDWQPDSPEFPEPRGTPPRYPDPTFSAVREAIAPMKLGLWMSAMHFNPSSQTFAQHPEWACQPFAEGLYGLNQSDPYSGSNEAGIVPWGPDAIPFIESRIRTAITEWGVTYFKFDFLAWLDCAGQGDFHHFRDAFVAMLDRLRADHPSVTLQIDETNDYRLFPFASTTRGPTWFQNGNPEPKQLLHNLWNLSPYVPSYALGQHVLGGDAWKRHPVATLMAAALPSHISFFTDIRTLPDDVVDEAGRWLTYYKAHRELFAGGVTYPLLDDPLGGGWTALQTWNPDRGSGALLAFRQESDQASRSIALRNVPAGRTFRLTRVPDGADLGTATSAELRAGLPVEIGAKDGAAVIAITPAG